MWSTSPATEKYHVFLTIFKKPRQYQEQIFSIPQLLTPTLPGWLGLLWLLAKKVSELMCELAAGKMFCLFSRFSSASLQDTICWITCEECICHSLQQEREQEWEELHQLYRYSTTPGLLTASETQRFQMRVEPLHMLCGTLGGRETSVLLLWDGDRAQEHWSTHACALRGAREPAWACGAGERFANCLQSYRVAWAGTCLKMFWA